MSRIAVLLPQVPFVKGGAEAHAEGLVAALRRAGHESELVTVPYKWYPREELLEQPLLWRLLDLTESDGRPIDLVIGTKFPSYCALHPRKVVWLIHQFRQVYDLWGTAYSDFTASAEDEAVRAAIVRADGVALGEARHVFTNAKNTAERLRRFNGLDGEALYHPPPLEPLLRDAPASAPGTFVLSVGRLDELKRIDLLLEAASRVRDVRVKVAGVGPAEGALRARAGKLGIDGRVEFLGRVRDDALAELYRAARAIWFAPFDEDYGYVTLEAFFARRPVVTTTDAGGVLEWVENGVTGWVARPEPEALADVLGRVVAEGADVERMGRAGRERVETVTWEHAVRRLLEAGGIA